MISAKKKTLINIIWKASKVDLFTALPWFPLYSFSEVFLAICSGALIQLIFLNSPIIDISDLAPGKFKSFMPHGISLSRSDIVFLLPITMVFLGFIKLISRFLSTYLTERAGHRTSYQMRQEMLSAFLSATGNKIDSVNIDQFSNQLIQDTALLQDAINKGTISAVRDFLVLISIIISMLIISWKAFLIGIAIIIPCITGLRFVSKKLNYYTREGQKRQINLSTRMLQTHAGAFVVHALRSQKREHHDLESLNSENYKFLHKSLFIRTIFSPATEFFAICVLLAIFVWRVNYTGDVQASGYSSMLILVVFSFRYIKNISSTITFFSDVRVVITRIVNSLHDFTNRNSKNLLIELPSYSKDALIAENISYEINGKKIITDCSVHIVKGSKIAFIGESGAGKSSFLRIICGLLEPTKGKVSIQNNFLLSLQTPYIYKGNVQENIIYNNKDKYKNLDTEKCKDLMSALGLSYSDTGTQIFLNKNLGFLGDGLSGGEKARVALSRILFADPKIILLDEPTANLDPKSSELFWKAIDKWHAQDSEHTVIAVSHLIKEISHFDLCYIFKDGKISEQIHPKAYLKRV